MLIEPRTIEKPWGSEVIWAETDNYVGKYLLVNAGCRLSRQYHEFKQETMTIQFGRAKMTWRDLLDKSDNAAILCAGDTFHVEPGVIHRVEALENTCIIEVSTPQLDDVVRLEDDYLR